MALIRSEFSGSAVRFVRISAGRLKKLWGIASALPLGLRLRRAARIPIYLDVGGRGGLSTRWAVMARLGLVRCILVEPDPSAAAVLQRDHPRSTVIRQALGDQNGTATLYVTAAPGSSSLLRPLPSDRKQYSVERLEEVNVVTWDSLKDLPQPTFVKIDVQGFELHVLEGMITALDDSVLAIQIETTLVQFYEDQPLIQEIWSWLDLHGLSLCDIRPLGVHEYGTIEFNAFFVRRNASNGERLAVDFWKRLLCIPSHDSLIGRSD